MSYNLEVKKSLPEKSRKGCCKKAELYGYLLCGKLFSEEEIIISEIDGSIIEIYRPLIVRWLGHDISVIKNGRIYSSVISGKDTRRLFVKIGISAVGVGTDADVIHNECCKAAFLRGMFIACGVVSDPKKRYSLEFTYSNEHVASFCEELLHSMGYEPGHLRRKEHTVLYIKSSEGIKDFLSTVGAIEYMFDYANTGILKELQNNVNRVVNCENANIDKAVKVLTEQRALIRELKKRGYKGLTPELVRIAEARLNSESVNLEALGEELDPPLSKTTVYRKLKKICEIAAGKSSGKEKQ